MNLNRSGLVSIPNLVSSLGCSEDDRYNFGNDCLNALECLESELLIEDIATRDVRLFLYNCEIIQNDLIPIIIHSKDGKILAATIRLLVNLTLPTELLIPSEIDVPQNQHIRNNLHMFSFLTKKAFLNANATLSIVTILRETIIKSEKYQYPLKEEDCIHLKNCILLLQNILYFPDEDITFAESVDSNFDCNERFNWQSVQNKLIWNLFVQGLGGALLLMFNSVHKEHWTVPLASIIALLYRNQNMYKVHQALQLVSSSESSGDDEGSDESKHSSTSLSSEHTKMSNRLSDSGCPQSSDTYSMSADTKSENQGTQSSSDITSDCCSSDIHTKFQGVRISDDPKQGVNHTLNSFSGDGNNRTSSTSSYDIACEDVFMDDDSAHSSPTECPSRKKVRGVCCIREPPAVSEDDSAMSELSSSEFMMEKPYDCNVLKDRKHQKNHKVNHKVRCAQADVLESDSSNEDSQNRKSKLRIHPPTCRRGKSPRRYSGCSPSICLEAAFAASCNKSRIRYPLWEKRTSVSKLVDVNSPSPSEDDISDLLKEFTLSFMHSGLSKLIYDVKGLLFKGPLMMMDKSLFFWLVTYFLHLATHLNITLDHLNGIFSFDVISYLVYESVISYESVQLNFNENERITKYALRHLNLSVTALKEVITAVDLYSRKPSQKDKAFFAELCGKLSELEDLRQLPLLLLQNYHPATHNKKYLEDVIVLNHQILIIVGKESEHCWHPKRIDLSSHIKQFATQAVINTYGKVLDDYKSNSQILNDCVFTMMHHVAGDIHASQLLIQPAILKTFSGILQEDIVLEQYQEDLIMYILNRFSQQVKKRNNKRSSSSDECSEESDNSSSNSSFFSTTCLLSEEDDNLFWWYLQFEQDEDPVSRISEHILLPKQDILLKLQLKGIISQEKFLQLEDIMGKKQVNDFELSDDSLIPITNFDDDITHLLRTLVDTGHRQHFIWLQDVLLETCYAKLGLTKYVVEPVPFNSIKMMLSIPIVPYTEEQKSMLKDKVFLQLLERLGFHLTPTNILMLPRIPIVWSPDVLFTIAARLGPIRKDKLKFTYEDLMLSNPNCGETDTEGLLSILPPLSSCNTLSSWLTAVQHSKEQYRTMNDMDVSVNTTNNVS